MQESGRMIRSALEWLMSRSCQSATFSSAATALPANDTRQSAQAFAGDRVALVRHGGAAFLAGAEKLLHLEHFGSLQMPELGRPAIDARRDERERRAKFRVPIALDDLGGKLRRLEPELLADVRSIRGSRCACVPTAPLSLPTRTRSSVCARRSSARPNSSNISASFSPKVIGSA